MKQKSIPDKYTLCSAICLLQSLCENICKIRSHTGEGPSGTTQQALYQQTEELIGCIIEKYPASNEEAIKAQTLLTMMDAYEVLGDKSILQFTLKRIEPLLATLPSSPIKCKLFSYAYYYVEEPECAEAARNIIESWKNTPYTEEMKEAVRYYRELIGEDKFISPLRDETGK